MPSDFFYSGPFMPHGGCYLWTPSLIALHAISDALIVLAYYSIPILLLYFARKRNDLKFHWMFVCFAVFILACGTTHLLEIWNIWQANYWLSGCVKAITALASVTTAILLVKVIPQALALPRPDALQKAYGELEQRVSERTLELKKMNETLVLEVRERQQAKQESYESEARLRAVLNSSLDAVITINSEGAITDWNTRAETIFGWTQKEVWGRELAEIIIPQQHRDAHRQGMKHFLATGEGPVLNRLLALSAMRRNGEEFPVELFISVLKTGDIVTFCGFITDITERQRSEEAFRESESRFRALVMASSDVVYRMNPDWSQMRQLDGRNFIVSTETASDNWLHEYIYPEDQAKVMATIHHAIETETSFELEHRVRRVDGTEGWTFSRAIPRRNTSGEIVEWFGAASDVTERKQTEEALAGLNASSLARLAAIVEFSDDAIIGKDLQGVVTSWNSGAEKLFGFPANEIIGQAITRIIPSDRQQEEIEILERIARGDSVKHFDTVRVRKDGSLVSISVTISPIKDLTGKVVGASKVARDNTESKKAEAQLRADVMDRVRVNLALKAANNELAFQVGEKGKRADELAVMVEERMLANQELAFQSEEKGKRADELVVINAELTRSKTALERSNVELGQFAYIASHDLQTPLRNISGFVQLLKANYTGKLDAKADGWINRITESTSQMHTLIQDVLTYSRVDSRARPFESVSLEDVFDESVVLLEASIHDAGGRVTRGELPSVMGDRSQLVQLTQNLIGNGLKYHGEQPPHIHVSTRREGGNWLLSVHDNGIGIATKHLERIFEIFKRLHDHQEYPGTGIGLAVCRRVVERHGGKIWAESDGDGFGSTFNFTIPVIALNKL